MSTWTAYHQRKLDTAVKRIVEAGCRNEPGHLPHRLRSAFASGNYGSLSDVLLQARSWASIVTVGADRQALKRARRAIGELWACLEVEVD